MFRFCRCSLRSLDVRYGLSRYRAKVMLRRRSGHQINLGSGYKGFVTDFEVTWSSHRDRTDYQQILAVRVDRVQIWGTKFNWLWLTVPQVVSGLFPLRPSPWIGYIGVGNPQTEIWLTLLCSSSSTQKLVKLTVGNPVSNLELREHSVRNVVSYVKLFGVWLLFVTPRWRVDTGAVD